MELFGWNTDVVDKKQQLVNAKIYLFVGQPLLILLGRIAGKMADFRIMWLRWRQQARTLRRRLYLSRERDHHYLNVCIIFTWYEVFVQANK
jgi:hypothetical protein